MFYQSIFPLLLYCHFYVILLIYLDKHKNLVVINLLLSFFPIIKSLLKTKSISITIYNGGSCVFRGFPMLQLPYQFGWSGMDRLNIPLRSLVLTLLCGIHSRSALGITSGSGWNSSQNPPLHLLHCPQPFLVPLLKHNGFMFLHWLNLCMVFCDSQSAFSLAKGSGEVSRLGITPIITWQTKHF